MSKTTTLSIIYFIIIASLIFFFALGSGAYFGWLFWQRFVFTFTTIISCFAIFVSGFFLVNRFFSSKFSIANIVISFCLGTYICSSVFMVLGYLGWLTQLVALLFVLTCNVLGWRIWVQLAKKIVGFTDFWSGLHILTKALTILVILLIALSWLHTFIPPLDYDVLEYHLGAPGEYFKAGKIVFLANNVYANFPQNMETIAFFYMQLCKSKLSGAFCAKLTLWVYGLVLIAAIYILARVFIDREEAWLAGMLAYALPWTGALLRKYYVEIPLVLILLVCIYLIIEKNLIAPKKKFFLLGILLGAAIGIKYTALFFGIFAISPFVFMSKFPEENKFKLASLAAIGIFLGYLPWFVRNIIFTNNPIYPLLNPTIIPGYWTDFMYERFRVAHGPSSFTLEDIWAVLSNVSIFSVHLSILHLPFVLPALWLMWKSFRGLFYFCFIWLVLWLTFTHRIERFIYPLWVLLCIPMGVVVLWMAKALTNKSNVIIMAILCSLNFYHNIVLSGEYDYLFGFDDIDTLFQKVYPPNAAENFINEKLQNSGKVLMLGEARTFYLDVPVEAHTVFDKNLLEDLFNNFPTQQEVIKELKKRQIQYIYVNWNEVNRLSKTYQFVYKGKRISGYLNIKHQRLHVLLRQYCRRIFPKTKSKDYAKIEVYILR